MDKPPLSAVVAVQSDDPAALKRRVEMLERLLVGFLAGQYRGTFDTELAQRHRLCSESVIAAVHDVCRTIDAVDYLKRGDHG